MAEEKKLKSEQDKQEKSEKKQEKEKQPGSKPSTREKKFSENVVRILSTDIPANMALYAGLTKIKGISWAFSNAIYNSLNLDKNKKLSELSEADIQRITDFVKNPNVPSWLLNRRRDIDTGKDKHLVTVDLDLQKDMDIRIMKKIKSYKGVRHLLGQPVRGQRTRAHFRKGKSVGVHRTKVSTKK